MENKIRFSEQPKSAKIIYGIVIAILIFSAVIVGLVATNNRDTDANTPPIGGGTEENPPVGENEPPVEEDTKKPAVFTAPTSGVIITEHSLTVPVFSPTLGEWRVHTGVDIECESGSAVYCTTDGTVSKIFLDPMLGMTVEVTHEGDVVSIYSNLDSTLAEGIEVGKTIAGGSMIGTVGDTTVSEMDKESHLHFGIRAKGLNVNPLDYLSDEIKKAAFGIETTPDA